MDDDLRSQLNVQLINKGYDKKIQDHLLYTLNAHPNNWPTQVQTRALALLRTGDVTTFPQLLKQILEEVRKETALEPKTSTSNGNGNDTSVQVNGGGGGPSAKKANGAGPGPGEASNLHQHAKQSLAVPQTVVDDALKVTKEALLAIAEFDDVDGAS